MTAFCPCQGHVVDDGQVVDVVKPEDFLALQRDDGQGATVVALARVQPRGMPPILLRGSMLYLAQPAAF